MSRVLVLAISMAAITAPALAQETVPYAYRPPTLGDSYVPDLGYIMGDAQLRHIKLWLAGKDKNWELANYEFSQLLSRLNESIRLYRNIPVEQIEKADAPLMELNAAIKLKNAGQFDTAFRKVTDSCNTCHREANVGFIVMKIPTTSPFSDQSFLPNSK